MPDAALPSRFLEEVPQQLLEDLSGGRERATTWGGYAASYSTGSSSRSGGRFNDDGERHYSYEDEDQSAPASGAYRNDRNYEKPSYGNAVAKQGRDAGSIDNIASFFSSRGVPPRNVPSCLFRRRRAWSASRADSVSATQSTAMAWSSAARVTATTRRLQYNSRSSA